MESAVKKRDIEASNLLNELLTEYYNNLEICSHDCYIDNGYYKFHNGDILETTKEEAEFRHLICSDCGRELYLIKTDNIDWDNSINGHKINVQSLFDSEILPLSTVNIEIKNLIENYYNLRQEYCGHIEFINRGYYSIQDKSIQKGSYNNSDFRIVTCKRCKKTMLLPKTDNEQWNSIIDTNAITVMKTKKNILKTL